MSESDDQYSGGVSNAEQPERASHLSLAVLGVLFVLWGIGPSLASFLYAWLKTLSSPLGPIGFVELLHVIAVFCMVPMKLMRALPRPTLWTVLAIGFVGYVGWNFKFISWTLGSGPDWNVETGTQLVLAS